MLKFFMVFIAAILPGIYINGIDVGKMERQEAQAVLEAAFGLCEQRLVVKAGDVAFEYSFADFGARYDFSAALDEAVAYSEKGGFFANWHKKRALKAKPLRLNGEFVWDGELVAAAATDIAAKVQAAPIDPSYYIENGSFVFVRGQVGVQVDANALRAGIEGILRRRVNGEFTAKLDKTVPALSNEDFEKATQVLGSFSTPFDPSNPSRATNLGVANNYLNNQVILPGEVMSVCSVLRPRTVQNGYVEAGQIIGGLPDTGVGGGICQISSTLYMAALYAEMTISQRQAHSLMVSYMQPATDATIAEGLIDLKIKNNTAYPMLVQSTLNRRKHVVTIYGHESRPEGRQIRFESRLVEINPAEVRMVECPLLPAGKTQTVARGYDGAKYELYKIIYHNGQSEEVKINTSNYRPLHGTVRVGAQ